MDAEYLHEIKRWDNPNNRFWYKVKIKDLHDCWEWVAFVNVNGYGQVRFNGKTERAHRIAWRIVNGEITNNLHVLHRCDNRKCVNPNHLWLGTHIDNMNDRKIKNIAKRAKRPETDT